MRPWFAIGAMALTWLAACGSDETSAGPTGPGGSGPASSSSSSAGGGGGGGSASSGGGGSTDLPASFEVSGTVVDEDDTPVADAMVLQGGTPAEAALLTGPDGSFTITVSYPGFGIPGVVAAKQGYRASGVEFFDVPLEPVLLVLDRVEDNDNPSYQWQDPGVGTDPSTAFCGHCHERFAEEFQLSKHKGAASNPFVQGLYAGVSEHGDAASCVAAGGVFAAGLTPGAPGVPINKCYLADSAVGGGVLPDLNPSCGGSGQPRCDDPAIAAPDAPTSFGGCADCHAPGLNGALGGRNLHEATELGFEQGVFCDVCHKVADIDLAALPGTAGRLVIRRPTEPSASPIADFKPLVFGPLVDVPNAFMGAAVQPLFKEATFCAGCHQQEQPALIAGQSLDPVRWPTGLPVHSTFQEWLDGPYAASGTACQFCHMPAHYDMNNTIGTSTVENASITFGYPRPPEDIRSHRFRGPLDLIGNEPRLIDSALYTSVQLTVIGNEVEASVSLANIGCGHALPTGEPMRSLVLLVSASGTGCGTRPAVGGDTVFDVGGAHRRGVVGAGVNVAGTTVTWPALPGDGNVSPGMRLRAVRPSGVFDDYPGIGFFADPVLTPAEKGLQRHEPVSQATVLSVNGDTITLDASLSLQPGDIVYLGDVAADPPIDGDASRALAGSPGYAFARVLVDASGKRQVPHHRAVDIASDNRIPPGQAALSSHRFGLDPSCTDVTVRAEVLYRPHPIAIASPRAWAASDYVIDSANQTVTLP
jgi:hypothetical protein